MIYKQEACGRVRIQTQFPWSLFSTIRKVASTIKASVFSSQKVKYHLQNVVDSLSGSNRKNQVAGEQ